MQILVVDACVQEDRETSTTKTTTRTHHAIEFANRIPLSNRFARGDGDQGGLKQVEGSHVETTRLRINKSLSVHVFVGVCLCSCRSWKWQPPMSFVVRCVSLLCVCESFLALFVSRLFLFVCVCGRIRLCFACVEMKVVRHVVSDVVRVCLRSCVCVCACSRVCVHVRDRVMDDTLLIVSLDP